MSIFSPHSRSSSRLSRTARGFTLIELLVVIAIITILTAVLLLQQRKFDSSTLLRSLAYSVALSVRQAQVYGTSVREFGAIGSGNFNYNYGVSFSSGDLNNYYLFADVTGDTKRASDGSEDVQTFKLGSGYTMTDFCGITNSSSQSCMSAGAITRLTIYFKRPNPDAKFSTDAGSNYCGAYIVLSGPGGDTRTVKVTSTGQILIGAINTPVTSC